MAMLFGNSAPKNAMHQAVQQTSKSAKEPSDEQDRISYGVISKVNVESSQVKVRLLKDNGKISEEELTPFYLPLINSLMDIHLRFGMLREGLLVRVFWKGKLKPDNAIIEVIGDEDSDFLKKTPEVNEVTVGSYQIFSGGISI